jgi:stress-induced morphogen
LSLIVIIVSLLWGDSKTFQSIAVAGRLAKSALPGPPAVGPQAGRRLAILYAREAMPSPEDIRQRIEASIPGASAEVEDYTGGGDHFRATVTAAAFEGRSRIEQHRLVYEVFGAEIGGAIHALSLKTQTPLKAPIQ